MVSKTINISDFSNIVEQIYDCSIRPEHWPSVFEKMSRHIGSCSMAIDFLDMKFQEPVAGFSYGYQDSFRSSLIKQYARIWMLQSQFNIWPVGKPMYLDEILDENEFKRGLFYREWCKPQKHYDYAGMIAFRDQTRFVKLTCARSEDEKSFTSQQRQNMALLVPHICKSVAISDAFKLESIRAGLLETTLNGLTTGVFIVDQYGDILYLNMAAEQMVKSASILSIKNNRLSTSQNILERALESTLGEGLDGDVPEVNPTRSIALQSHEGDGLIAEILPLNGDIRGELYQGTNGRAAVFVREPMTKFVFPGEAFAELYRISKAEIRVAAAMSQGLTLQEVSNALGISHPTVKSHLQRMFEKTSTSRQADLLTLMANSSAGLSI